jgi:DNA repair ATPase RecN
MGTPNDLSDEEWETLYRRGQDVVNSDDDTSAACLELLFSSLDALTAKYGEISSLLSIRADFTHDVEAKKQLLYRAYSLAASANDHEHAFEAAYSIASMFVDLAGDLEGAERWLGTSLEHLGQLDDSDFLEEHRKKSLEYYREDIAELAKAVADMRRSREKLLN